ncbi:MAG: hypothetical protein KatS3mg080_0574 [Anoxybacillus sp.]|uniref:ABC-2 family transporter protein n=1 Tax=Anoxybacillus suryakundensis TaxID=1325335 RepID=A0A0K6GLK2_9BACL|nr:ABC-2 transporter permease [Anoxybacillus suryakundensis]AST06532.1 ABC transporter permease [Anoxybacillus flavithermus]GIW49963.1 MAG: hypothetical protein KatS3mg080_0574 [Anoxybacillus sp.]CUA79604.1 ABC-2 family transporter protein [Anoxybacillus suryakundensis]
MLRLILKDLYTQKKIVYFSPLLSLPYFLSMGKNISGSNFIAIVIYSLCIAFIAYFMAMYTNFNTGESEINQNRLILSLPVTRRSVINAKYIMISVWWLFSYTSHILIFILMNVVDTSMTFNQLLDMKVLLLSLCFTYLLMSIFYPLNYKFGFRVASPIGIAVFFLVTSGVGKILSSNKAKGMISIIIDQPIISFSIIAISVTLVSYVLTAHIFTNKDF